jgi:Transmembrane protein 65
MLHSTIRPRFLVVIRSSTRSLSDSQEMAGVLSLFLRRRRSTMTVNLRHGSTNRMQSIPNQCHPQQQQQQQPRSIRQLPLSTSVASFPEFSCPSFIIASSTSTSTSQQLAGTPIQVPHTVTTTASVVAPTTMTAAAAVPLHHHHHNETIPLSDLRALFIASSIPMIGFGFMDQFVLIQAGGYIDATFGIRFGLATLTAAAAGQVVSDVSGVLFGGALERVLTNGWLRTPQLTPAQRQLPIGRNVSMLGAVVGVIIGCAIGATSLLLVDLEARNRMERAQRLRDIVQDMITVATPATTTTATTLDPVFSCDSCTVYVVSKNDLTLPADHETSHQWRVQLKDISSSIATSIRNDVNDNHGGDDTNDEISLVQQCLVSRSIVLSHDRRVMYAPLVKRSSPQHDIMAVVAFRYGTNVTNHALVGDNDHDNHNNNNSNNRREESSPTTSKCCYSDDDILTARVMARHIAIFMDR